MTVWAQLYWFGGCITSSMRLYYESMDWRVDMLQQHPNKVPPSISCPAKDGATTRADSMGAADPNSRLQVPQGALRAAQVP